MKRYLFLLSCIWLLPAVFSAGSGTCSAPYTYMSEQPSGQFFNTLVVSSITLKAGTSAGWCTIGGQQTTNGLTLRLNGASGPIVAGPGATGYTSFFSGGTFSTGDYTWTLPPPNTGTTFYLLGSDSTPAATAVQITYYTDNTAPDFTNWGSIMNPAHGIVTFTPTITDNWLAQGSVAWVAFYFDGALIVNDTTTPYSATIDASLYANGLHSLSAVIQDKAGNARIIAPTGVTISNPVCNDGYCDTSLSESTISCPADCLVTPDCAAPEVWNPSTGFCDAGVCDVDHIGQACGGAFPLSDPSGDGFYCSDGLADNGVAGDGYCCDAGYYWAGFACLPTDECRDVGYCIEADDVPFDINAFVANPYCASVNNPGVAPSGLAACCQIPGGKFGTSPFYDYSDASGSTAANIAIY